MAPGHPRGAASGTEEDEEAGASVPSSAPRRDPRARDDSSFMEQVVNDMLAQNERARSISTGPPSPPSVDRTLDSATDASISLHATTPSARSPALSPPPERPRTVRVERDSGFRTPEGVATARAYLPAKTVAPGRTEAMDIETVKVSDPRKLPTVRLPRERREEILREGAGRGPRSALPEDSAPTLRSAPVTALPQPQPPRRSVLGLWIAGVVGVALFGALLVALAARFWPSVSARPEVPPAAVGPSVTLQPPASAAPTAAPAASDGPEPSASATAAPPAAPTSEASAPVPSTRPGPKSDRWY